MAAAAGVVAAGLAAAAAGAAAAGAAGGGGGGSLHILNVYSDTSAYAFTSLGSVQLTVYATQLP